jgi:hypothetical protein
MQHRKTVTTILAVVILVCGPGRLASRANPADYYPLPLGSWSEYQFFPSHLALVRGKVVDAITGEGISGASIAFTPGSFSLTTGLDGSFFSIKAPTGIYSVRISADRYETRRVNKVNITPGVVNELSTLLIPRAPIVSVTPLEGFNDGLLPVLITARVTHPDGIQNVASVSTNLSELGGKTEQALYDDGTHGDPIAGDGLYSYEIMLGPQPGRDREDCVRHRACRLRSPPFHQ